MIRRKLLQPGIVLSALTAITAMVVSPLALAAGEIEEIIVTAAKRGQDIQRVSIAVTAIENEAIERLGIIDISGLEGVVPGLKVGQSGSEVRLAMRGARTNDVGVATPGIAEQTVGIFLDGIYVPTTTAGLGAYVDVNRIEVLRGPQGTLYGRNTYAGSVNIISNAPAFNEVSGGIKVTVGDYNRAAYEGVLNLSHSDKVATRLVMSADSHDGMITNHHIPGSSDDLREKNSFYARWVTEWKASDTFSTTLRFDYSTKDSNSTAIWGYQQIFGYSIVETALGSGVFLPDAVVTEGHPFQVADVANDDLGPYDVYRNALSLDQQDALSATLIFNWSMDSFDIKWTNNYSDLDGEQYYDSDASDGNCDRVCGFGRGDQHETVSSELLFTSNNDGSFSWVGGLYYFSQEADWNWLVSEDSNGDDTQDSIFAPSWGNSAHDPHTVDSLAVFGQATFALSDSFRLVGGLRYNEDDKTFTGGTEDWDDTFVSWKAAVEFDTGDNTMWYASGSTGYRTGGQNDARVVSVGAPLQFDNEEVISFEVGAKTTLLDGSMTLNVAAYVNEYSDVKAQVFAVACTDSTLGLTVLECVALGGSNFLTFEFYENGGGIDTTGLEVEMQWAPSDNWFISANLALMDSEFSSDYAIGSTISHPLLGLGNIEGRQDINDPDSVFSFAGWKPAFSPDYTVGFATKYDIHMSGGSILTPSINLRLTDDYYTFDINVPEVQQDGFTYVDLRLAWSLPDSGVSIDAFVMNATDEVVMTRTVLASQIVNNLPIANIQANWNNPRTWGVSFRYNF